MQRRTKKAILLVGVLGLCYVIVEELRSPQADTRRIAQEKRHRVGTWNGMYDIEDCLHSSERG
jgi:hypothetical protein